MKCSFRALFRTCLLLIAAGGLCVVLNGVMPVAASQQGQYEILEDDMGSRIAIGVSSSINEDQLRAALVRAADEHQDDLARDYLSSLYLAIDAYLVSDQHRSKAVAGQLKRYVPFLNPSERKTLKTDRRKNDKFKLSLLEARRSLN